VGFAISPKRETGKDDIIKGINIRFVFRTALFWCRVLSPFYLDVYDRSTSLIYSPQGL